MTSNHQIIYVSQMGKQFRLQHTDMYSQIHVSSVKSCNYTRIRCPRKYHYLVTYNHCAYQLHITSLSKNDGRFSHFGTYQSNLFDVHSTLSGLPAPGCFWWVCRSHTTGHRGQELLSLLLHKTSCTDDFMARSPQVRPVHFLCKVFSDHF